MNNHERRIGQQKAIASLSEAYNTAKMNNKPDLLKREICYAKECMAVYGKGLTDIQEIVKSYEKEYTEMIDSEMGHSV